MVTESSETFTLLKRYTDAYIVVRVTVGIGNSIKIIGIVLAVLIFIAALGLGSYLGGGAPIIFLFFGLIGLISALVVGIMFYVIGIIVSAQGQILQASLDSAVNGSPFLTNERKSQIMSLGASNNKLLSSVKQEFVEQEAKPMTEQMTAEQIEILKSQRRANHQCEECGVWLGVVEDMKGIKMRISS